MEFCSDIITISTTVAVCRNQYDVLSQENLSVALCLLSVKLCEVVY